MHCFRLGIEARTLKATTKEEAQQEALGVVKAKVDAMLAELTAMEV